MMDALSVFQAVCDDRTATSAATPPSSLEDNLFCRQPRLHGDVEAHFEAFYCTPHWNPARRFASGSSGKASASGRLADAIRALERRPEQEEANDAVEEQQHWTSLAMQCDSTVSTPNWEMLRPVQHEDDSAECKEALTDCADPQVAHLLWAVCMDRLRLTEEPSADLHHDWQAQVAVLPEAELVVHLSQLMVGIQSSSFRFDEDTHEFAFVRHIVVPGVTFESLSSYCRQFLHSGGLYRWLEQLLQENPEPMQQQMVYQALMCGLSHFLLFYRASVSRVTCGRRLLELALVTKPFRALLDFVVQLFTRLMQSGSSISALMQLCHHHLPSQDVELHHLFLSLFRAGTRPFFRFLSNWSFYAKWHQFCGEFGIQLNESCLLRRDRSFWTNAFQLAPQVQDQNHFLASRLLPLVLVCGKITHFLKLTKSTCPVLNFAPPDVEHSLELILTTEQEEEVNSKYTLYCERFQSLVSYQSATSSGVSTPRSPPGPEISSAYHLPDHIGRLLSSGIQDLMSKFRPSGSEAWSGPRTAADNIFTPLSVIMEKSILIPLRAQYLVLNAKAAYYLTHEAHLHGHLRALRNYLLLGDAEFAHGLCCSLFSGARDGERGGAGTLNMVVDAAICSSPFACKDPLAQNVSFLRQQHFDMVNVDAFRMSYSVHWPLNIILTPDVLDSYGDVFLFLLKLYKCNWRLQRAFSRLKADRSPSVAHLHLMRHEMTHFVVSLDSYVKSAIIEQSWLHLQAAIEQPLSAYQTRCGDSVSYVDVLYKAHMDYIKNILVKCFLNKKAEPVHKLISEVLDTVDCFCKTLESGGADKYLGTKLSAIFHNFQQYESSLSSVLWKLTQRGYQHHLQDLLRQLSRQSAHQQPEEPVATT